MAMALAPEEPEVDIWDIDYPDDPPSRRTAKFLNRDWPPQHEEEWPPKNWEEPKLPSKTPTSVTKPVKYPSPKKPTTKSWLRAPDPTTGGAPQLRQSLTDQNPQNRYQVMVNGYPVYHHFSDPKMDQYILYPMYFTPDQVNRLVQTPIYNFTNDLGLAYCFLIMDLFDVKSKGFFWHSTPHHSIPAMRHKLYDRRLTFSYNPSWALHKLSDEQRDIYMAAHSTRDDYYQSFVDKYKEAKGRLDTSGIINYSPVKYSGQRPDAYWRFMCSNDGIVTDHKFSQFQNSTMLFLIPYQDLVIFLDKSFDISVQMNSFVNIPHNGIQTLYKFLNSLSKQQITYTTHDDGDVKNVCDYVVQTEGMRKMLVLRDGHVRYWETRGSRALGYLEPAVDVSYSSELELDQPISPRAARDPKKKRVVFKNDEELIQELEEDPLWYQHIGYWEVTHFNELGDQFARFRDQALSEILALWHPHWVEMRNFSRTIGKMLSIRSVKQAALSKNFMDKNLQDEYDKATKDATEYKIAKYEQFNDEDMNLENQQIEIEDTCMKDIFKFGQRRHRVNQPRQLLIEPILTSPTITELLRLIVGQDQEDKLKSACSDDNVQKRLQRHKIYVKKFLELRKRLVAEIWKCMGFSESNWQ